MFPTIIFIFNAINAFSGELWDSAPCSSGQMFVCQQSAKVSTTPEEIVSCGIFLKKVEASFGPSRTLSRKRREVLEKFRASEVTQSEMIGAFLKCISLSGHGGKEDEQK